MLRIEGSTSKGHEGGSRRLDKDQRTSHPEAHDQRTHGPMGSYPFWRGT